MRSRAWAAVPIILLIVAVAAAACAPGSRAPQGTPIPTKTLRPTFTYTPVKQQGGATATSAIPPTATRQPAAAPTAVPPTVAPPTAVPPTIAPPTATPEKATLTTTDSARVRSGPGTNYSILGEVRQGQTFEVTGKNQAGDWWQITFEGQPAWLIGQYAQPNAAASKVPVAANIPAAPPTARPAPTSPPAPPAPAATQAPPPSLFAQAGAELRNADDVNFGVVTFWGRLGKTTEMPIAGYKLRVSAPTGTSEMAFGAFWENANPGQPSEFRYNAKIELPRTAGGFRAVVVDGSGKEVSDAISGTLLDRTHDVILNWWKR